MEPKLSFGWLARWMVCTAGATLLVPSTFAVVDLRISDDEVYSRPNSWSSLTPAKDVMYAESAGPTSRPGLSIAWRNANQVEEVEVRVQNLGDEPGEGTLYVDVLDATGKKLLHLEPPDELRVVRIPAREQGGKEGKIIRMKASWELNALIDRFDLTRTQYGVSATIETIGAERNWSDNRKTKEWNLPYRVTPGKMNVYNYTFKNQAAEPIKVKWLYEHSNIPAGWNIEGLPKEEAPFVLEAGKSIEGTLLMKAPADIVEGSFLEARLSLVDGATGGIIQQHEWFQVYDTEKPIVSNYRAVMLEDHTIAIQLLAADKGSGILEATGVSTQFSVDGGKTWASKSHNYKVGNFVRPTLFETILGPFAPTTKVLARMTVMDTAGNAQTTIPEDASAFKAPPQAEKLLQQAYIFPRTQQNPLFDLQKLKELNLTLDKLKSANIDIKTLDLTKPNSLNISPKQLELLGMDQQRLADLRDDLIKMGELNVNVDAIVPVETKRVKAIGEDILQLTTLEFTAQ